MPAYIDNITDFTCCTAGKYYSLNYISCILKGETTLEKRVKK